VSRRRRSALLWGVIGALVFLVLHGIYLLFGGVFLGVAPITAATAGLFAVTAVVSYYVEGRFGLFVETPDDRE
jgi:predicted tellurium resistance membrane protein TerC